MERGTTAIYESKARSGHYVLIMNIDRSGPTCKYQVSVPADLLPEYRKLHCVSRRPVTLPENAEFHIKIIWRSVVAEIREIQESIAGSH